MRIDIDDIIGFLESNSIVSQLGTIEVDETATRGVYKIRCNLIPSQYKLQIKWIDTPESFHYSYQVFAEFPLLRWDNAPHFPDIQTYPHHFHDKNGNVFESPILGEDIKGDLKMVFDLINNFLMDDILG